MTLYIVRHGESKGNVSSEPMPDPALTPLGEHQAELLGKRFAEKPLNAVFSSPLLRALSTATAVVERQPSGGAHEITVLPQLMEEGTPPDYAGLPISDLKRLFVKMNSFTPQPLGVEDINMTFGRAKAVIDKITASFSQGESVMLCAHGSFNQRLISAALGFEKPAEFTLCQLNTCVTKITFNENGCKKRLTYFDDVSHLLTEYPNLFDNI